MKRIRRSHVMLMPTEGYKLTGSVEGMTRTGREPREIFRHSLQGPAKTLETLLADCRILVEAPTGTRVASMPFSSFSRGTGRNRVVILCGQWES